LSIPNITSSAISESSGIIDSIIMVNLKIYFKIKI
jgi:hypothetical protein